MKIKLLSFVFVPWGHLSLTVIVATPITVIRVVIVSIATSISIALLSVAIILVVSLPVAVTLIPVLALA